MSSFYAERQHAGTRLASVESFRGVAMLIVVCLHANLFARLHVEGGAYGFIVDFPLYLLWWLGVPYFFLVSGYFYGQKIQAGSRSLPILRSSCVSLLWLYLIWSAIYSLIPRHWLRALTDGTLSHALSGDAWPAVVLEHVRDIVLPWPPYYHLWFLPALLIGLATVALVTTTRFLRTGLPLLVALYAFMVAAEVLQSRTGVGFEPFRAASLAMFFTVLGSWVAYRRPISARLALGLMLGGTVLAVTEAMLLKVVFHIPSIQVGAYPYAGAALLVLGLFILLLAKPTWGQGTVLPTLARYTLGVYVCHILIEHTLAPIHDQLPQLSAVWYVPYVISVYGLSVLLTWMLMRVPWLQALVVRENASPGRFFRSARPWVRIYWSQARYR